MSQSNAKQHWGAFIFGLLLGTTAGLVIGILNAPRAGKDTLAMIGEETAAITLQVQQGLRRDSVQQAMDDGKAVVREHRQAQSADAEEEEAEQA